MPQPAPPPLGGNTRSGGQLAMQTQQGQHGVHGVYNQQMQQSLGVQQLPLQHQNNMGTQPNFPQPSPSPPSYSQMNTPSSIPSSPPTPGQMLSSGLTPRREPQSPIPPSASPVSPPTASPGTPSTSNPPAKESKICSSCNLPIRGQFVRALDGVYHLDCFKCRDCGQIVAQKFFASKGEDGKPFPLCETDYFRRLDLICANCGGALRGSHITALGKKYHLEHFTCSNCSVVFKPHDSYYEHAGKVYCQYHFSVLFANRCGGCQMPVLKQYLELNRKGVVEQWHPECYMIYKTYNIKLGTKETAAQSATLSESDAKHLQLETEERISRIQTVLTAFEDSAAECIQPMLLQISVNHAYADGVRQAARFIQHVEALFAGIDSIEANLRAHGDRTGLQHNKEPRKLAKKVVEFFNMLSQTDRPASAVGGPGVGTAGPNSWPVPGATGASLAPGSLGVSSPAGNGSAGQRDDRTNNFLQLVTDLAVLLKHLIKAALQGALKLERVYSEKDSLNKFLNRLMETISPSNPPSGSSFPVSSSTSQGQLAGDQLSATDLSARSNALRQGGSSSSSAAVAKSSPPSFSDPLLTLITPELDGRTSSQDSAVRADMCAVCHTSLEDECLRCGIFRFHLACVAKCTSCGNEVSTAEGTVAKYDPVEGKPYCGRCPGSTGPAATTLAPCIFEQITQLQQYVFLLRFALRRLCRLLNVNLKVLPPGGGADFPHRVYEDDSTADLSEEHSPPQYSYSRGPDESTSDKDDDPPYVSSGHSQPPSISSSATRTNDAVNWRPDPTLRPVAQYQVPIRRRDHEAISEGQRYISELSPLESTVIHQSVTQYLQDAIGGWMTADEMADFTMKKPTVGEKIVSWLKGGQNNKKGGRVKEVLVDRHGEPAEMKAGYGRVVVPKMILACLRNMRKQDLRAEGIFRKNGNIKRLKDLTETLDQNPDQVSCLDTENVIQLAALIKKFLREMPDPLLTFRLHRVFTLSQKFDDPAQQFKVIHYAICLLPKPNRDLLEVLFLFLRDVADKAVGEGGNKMDVDNLATVMAPNILCSKSRDPLKDESFYAVQVVKIILERQDELWALPEELNRKISEGNAFESGSQTRDGTIVGGSITVNHVVQYSGPSTVVPQSSTPAPYGTAVSGSYENQYKTRGLPLETGGGSGVGRGAGDLKVDR
ncbi:RhoGAP-domain-containing protein [Gonapodya prolifera JEL478]|uniref:RhoGAP-domain-containing protein n=1 Tax=Gonapodya prolifera (strain JEL478) TaxID=1344416 RepID=A0A139APD1_GONPJ|nr:RhoGAP-domain-containing protein [Gonapodya prolifera JEL478]|eukprot:KXS18582.1 RhoGAP-domain-containing protein [Gonapodya prolifera JEL478]